MADRMKVREAPGLANLLVKFAAIPIVAAGSIVAVVNILPRLGAMDVNLLVVLFVLISAGPSALLAWLSSLGRRTVATTVLHIDGTAPDGPKHNDGPSTSVTVVPRSLVDAVRIMLREQVRKPPCVKVTLCEEGIVLYRSHGAGFVRWNRIRNVKTHRERGRFELTLKRSLGKDSFFAPHKFDEVRQMLSEHLSLN